MLTVKGTIKKCPQLSPEKPGDERDKQWHSISLTYRRGKIFKTNYNVTQRAPNIDLRRMVEYDWNMKEMLAQDNLFSTQILIIRKLHYRILTISWTFRISTWVPLLRIRKQSFFSISFSDRAFWPIATRQWALANNKVFDHAGLLRPNMLWETKRFYLSGSVWIWYIPTE